jgi:tripartite motif-containing protein 71
MRTVRVLFLALLLALFIACGGSHSSLKAPPGSTAGAITAVSAAAGKASASPAAASVSPPAAAPYAFVWSIDGSPNKFERPTALARDRQGVLYVVDGGNDRVQKFDANGKFLLMWGREGSGPGQFTFRVPPAHFGSIAVDAAGNVYVSDYNNRIQKFDGNGKFLLQWGTAGSGDGQFATPFIGGLAFDSTGVLYVTDTSNSRVQKFDQNGRFLGSFGGAGDGQLPAPTSIAIDAHGDVYVVPGLHADLRIDKFDRNGAFITSWGSEGVGDGQFQNVIVLAVDGNGTVYASDNGNHRIQIFDANGRFLAKFGSHGDGDGQFDYPAGIQVDDQGNLYVVDANGARIQKFRPR